ncbi:MAG: 5-formyltetrahydrofolate cyclo-ligase [Firmicutes bacterium]|nr:5-formyltetrahydrofolate cyclo-ligase [Bacillota bacterium]
MKTTNINKKILRKRINEIKTTLTSEYIKNSSTSIVNQVITLPTFKNSNIVMCYLSFGNEVDTSNLIKECQRLNKKILVPVIVKNKDGFSHMEASEIIDFENDLRPGFMGIMEPRLECKRITNPELIDFIIVPGLAFDKLGNRLGYGGGYYDNFLNRTRKECTQIAITFSHQLVDKVPTEEHDLLIKNLLTEDGFIIKEK